MLQQALQSGTTSNRGISGSAHIYDQEFNSYVRGFSNVRHEAFTLGSSSTQKKVGATTYVTLDYTKAYFAKGFNTPQKYRQIIESKDFSGFNSIGVAAGQMISAYNFALRNPGFVFVKDGTSGVLYDIRQAQPGDRHAEIDGSSFTQRTDDFDPATATLQELSERVKTLELKLQRSALI